MLTLVPGQFTSCSPWPETMAPMRRMRPRFRPMPWLLLAIVLGLAGLAGGIVGVLNLIDANHLNADTRFIEVSS